MALPSIDSLVCFTEAARLLNFRAAAKRVALTPAALGQRIKQLEEQLGARLFERTTRSVTLTEAGLALVPRAQAAIAAAGDCIRAARGEDGLPPMELTIGTRYELGLSFILPMRRPLEAAHRGLTLNVYFGSGPDLLIRVRNREIDCAVTSARLNDPVLDSRRLHREDYVFVGATGLLERTPLKKDEDAANHVLVDVGGELPLFRYWRDAPGGGDRLKFSRLLKIGTGEAARRCILEGAGVGVLPRYMVEHDLAAHRLKVLFPKVPPLFDYFRLVFRSDDPRRSVFEAMAQTLLHEKLR